MAEIFKFFNSAPGDERWHYASDFADYFGDVLSSGLIHKNNVPGLQVKVVSNSLKTVVDVGQALIKGYSYQNTTSLELTHNITEVGLNRIDRIVLRLDLRNANRFIKLFVREGEEAVTPVAPDLQRDQYIYELSLAQVKITSNSTIIDALSLVDERLKEEVCGIVYSLISVPTSVFQQQFDTWFNSQKSIYTDELNAWTTNQKALFETWRDSEVALFSDWKTEQENGFVDWRMQQQSDFQTWQTKEQNDFETWFASLENILDENTAATLVNKTNVLESELNTHKTNENAHGIGDKTQLATSEKGSIVSAINEIVDSKGQVNGIAPLNAEGKIDDAFLGEVGSDYELITEYTTTSTLSSILIPFSDDYDFYYIKAEKLKLQLGSQGFNVKLNDVKSSHHYTTIVSGASPALTTFVDGITHTSLDLSSTGFGNAYINVDISRKYASMHAYKGTATTKDIALFHITTTSEISKVELIVGSTFASGVEIKVYGKKGVVA